MTDPPRAQHATSPLRMTGYVASLALLAFLQQPGRIVADTKIDLVVAPWQFLERALHVWDPLAAFGQLQNQAYGYLWPMGPFFGLGELVALPPWVVQRLWWTLLLALAFVGVVRLCRELDIGTPWTQVAAAYAFVLSPRIATLLGASSVEIWPTALIPWVLIPLIRASRGGSVVRGAAIAALVVACCGGVNATAVSVVLPLGVLWILTRAPGPRRWRLLGWWTLFTGLATCWWLVPLMVLGVYSAPFLDYIENAALTSTPTDLGRSLVGISNWVAYLDVETYSAGHLLASTPFLLIDAAAIAALGLLGLALRTHPHQRFLVLGLLTGLVLVGLGYAGDLSGWWATERQDLLDGVLSPLRNTHKYDGIVRLVLVLGLAHALVALPRWLGETLRSRRVATTTHAMVAIVLVGMVAPWTASAVGTKGFGEVPDYWRQVATYLDRTATASPTLVLPAAEFGHYLWGSTRDDVLQPLAHTPWAVRNVIPLAEPGNVVLLDGITELLESGGAPEDLAQLLQDAGVGHVVLRHDLDRARLGSPEPDQVRHLLSAAPGVRRVATFGPTSDDGEEQEGRNRVITGGGPLAQHPAVEIFRVTGAPAPAVLVPRSGLGMVAGSPGAALRTEVSARLHPPDALRHDLATDTVVLTDSLRRREKAFQSVRWNESATLPRDRRSSAAGAESFHRMSRDDERWQTVETWSGIAGVRASSSQGWPGAETPLDRSAHPGAALDGDTTTSWRSARGAPVDEQWWELDFGRARTLTTVEITLGVDSVAVDRLRISAGDQVEVVEAPEVGEDRRYTLGWSGVERVRIAPVGVAEDGDGAVTIAEVAFLGVEAQRLLELPAAPDDASLTAVEMTRDRGRATCQDRGGTLVCRSGSLLQGEDGDVLARRFALPASTEVQWVASASLRRHPEVADELAEAFDLTLDAPGTAAVDIAQTAWALADDDEGTTWIGPRENPRVDLEFAGELVWDQLELRLDPYAVAARPTRLRLTAGKEQITVPVPDDGVVELPGWESDSLRVEIVDTEPTYVQVDDALSEPGPGISELRVNGQPLTTTLDLACGDAPELRIGGANVPTAVRHDLAGLLRGEPVELRACATGEGQEGDPSTSVNLEEGWQDLVGSPTDLLRVDRVDLRLGPDPITAPPAPIPTPVDLTRDPTGSPVAAEVVASDDDALLVLAQNFNPGWEARIGGAQLDAVRVNGWQQAWRVPAGTAGQLALDYRPAPTYQRGLLVGLVLAVGVGLVALLGRRRPRRHLPALTPGRVGVGDAVLVTGLLGLLGGWVAVAMLAALVLIGRRTPVGGWAPGAAALTTLVAALPLVASLGALTGWSQLLGQTSASLALSLTVVCLLRNGPAFFRRMK